MVLTTLTATLAIAATATAMAPAPLPAAPTAESNRVFTPASFTASVAAATPAQAAIDEALTTAQNALAASASVTSDIAASGLDIGVPATVDTAALETAVAGLETARTVPLFDLTDAADAVLEKAAPVSEQAAALRGQLDAAVAAEAERVAAENARLEAEAAAAEAAAAEKAATRSSSGGGSAPLAGGAVGGTSPADAQATARGMLGSYGWGDDQFSCLVSLWQKESGWNYQAKNKSSGAYGIPQALPGSKMASAGADWQTNPATQIAWGFGYISGRYGTPCGAWAKSQAVGWY